MRAVKAGLATGIVLGMSCGMAMAQSAGSEKGSGDPGKASPTYRLVYTVTDMDAGRRLGVQHFAMTANPDNGNAEIKMGSRVPIAAGSSSASSPLVNTQFQYVDVGLSIRARLHEFTNGVQVSTEVEQSGVADSPNADVRQPVIRQTSLKNSALLTAGKPVMLGSLDVPGSTRHLDIEVVLEMVR